MDELAQQLKAARRAQKVTLKTLAQRSGIHWVTLSRFENGISDMGVHKLDRLAQALGLQLTLRPATQGYTLDDLAAGLLQEQKSKSPDKTTSVLKRSRGLRG